MRKSRQTRIEEASSLMAAYESESLASDYRYRFISDMKMRLESGKPMSTKQRSWFDSLVGEGIPEIETDKEKMSEIKEALALKGFEHRHEPLKSFLSTLARGKNLSERQENFLSILLDEAKDVKKNGPYVPGPETIEKLKSCIKVSKNYSSMYWSTHPGTYRSLHTVGEWLGNQENGIDKWSVDKLLKAMRSKLDELYHKPYANTGDLVWHKTQARDNFTPGVVVEPASVNDRGVIVYGILSGSQVVSVSKDKITKRAIKHKGIAV